MVKAGPWSLMRVLYAPGPGESGGASSPERIGCRKGGRMSITHEKKGMAPPQ